MGAREHFDRLKDLVVRPASLAYAYALLEWDERTNAPKNGNDGRAIIMAEQAAVAHEAWVNPPEIAEQIKFLRDGTGGLEDHEILMANRWVMAYDRAKAFPTELVAARASVTTAAKAVWGRARAENDPTPFLPHLGNVLGVVRQEAECLGADMSDGNSIYTALLSGYEPGMTTERLEQISTTVCEWLGAFIRRINASPVQLSDALLCTGHFPAASQEQLCRALTSFIGFDYGSGHLIRTVHPFCTRIGPKDTRITTRYPSDNMKDSTFGVAHEAGHGMYDQGMNPLLDFAMTDGFTHSLGIHESQSRMWENMVCRSRPFWQFAWPALCTAFPKFHDVSLDHFMQAANVVQPSPIRTKADEVSYNLHIAFRVLMEIRMIRGDLTVDGHVTEFAQMMKKFVGYDPMTVKDPVFWK